MPKGPEGPGLRRALKWEVLAIKRAIVGDDPSLRQSAGIRLERCRSGCLRLALPLPGGKGAGGDGRNESVLFSARFQHLRSGPKGPPAKRGKWGTWGLAPMPPEAAPARSAWGFAGPKGPPFPHARRKNHSERRRQRRRPAWSLPLLRSSQGSGQSGRSA